jgi:23S rRNA pseudouridine1911/1915/1917 synthase
MAVVEGGRRARTDLVKLAEGENSTELIAARLHTGRTHQIRVHLSHLGRHILGDALYGFKSRTEEISRVYLHAYLLYLVHPVTQRSMEITAPLYDDMSLYLDNFFDRREINEKIVPEYVSSVFADSSAVS